MSNTITIKNIQLEDLVDAYSKAAVLHLSEGESADDVKKFKYAAGKNYNHLRALAKAAEKKQMDMQRNYSDPELTEYHEKRVALCKQYSEKDSENQPKMRNYEDGRPSDFMIEPALREDFNVVTKALGEEYKEALDRDNANDEATNAVLDEEVTLEIYTIPWSKVPTSVSGGYIDVISDMITDLPNLDNDDENKGLQDSQDSV